MVPAAHEAHEPTRSNADWFCRTCCSPEAVRAVVIVVAVLVLSAETKFDRRLARTPLHLLHLNRGELGSIAAT
jgi:hypothetical protein